MVGWNYKAPLVFYNTPETTVKGKVKKAKKEAGKASKKAVDQAVNEVVIGQLPDNMTSEEAEKKEGGNMTMKTYLEQICKPYIEPALQAARKEDWEFVLEEDGDGAHGTRSLKNIVVEWKKKTGIQYYANPPTSPDLSIIENVWRRLKQNVKKHRAKSVDQLK